MLDLSWTTHRFVSPPTAQRRVLVLVDRASADARILAKLAPATDVPPAALIWLWVVTPGAVVSWGALLAESGDRTRILLSALSERMEEARRYMTPLQRACTIAEIPCQTHILHGAVIESVVRLARGEEVEQVLLAANGGSLYGQPPQELAATLSRRMPVPVGILE
jgi:hypothetical protein